MSPGFVRPTHSVMSKRRIHFDYLNNHPVAAEVAEAMAPFLAGRGGDVASVHQSGRVARDAVLAAREQFASLLHAESPDSICFTASGTESTNLAIKGVAFKNQRRGRHIVTSAIEHPAVNGSIKFLEGLGFEATRVSVDRTGRVDEEQLRKAVRDDTILLATHVANHDIGTIQPLGPWAELAEERGVPLFVDATYAAGWLELDVEASGVHLAALSPHRFYGPKGIGVLYRHRRARMEPLIHGGTQERGLRAGTENIAGIVGAGRAAQLSVGDLADRIRSTRVVQERLLAALQNAIPDVVLHGTEPGPHRIVNQLNVSVPGAEGEGLMLMCDMQGVEFVAGSACTIKSMKVSPVLAEIGVGPDLARAGILLSFGPETTGEDVDELVVQLARAAKRLRDMSPGGEG